MSSKDRLTRMKIRQKKVEILFFAFIFLSVFPEFADAQKRIIEVVVENASIRSGPNVNSEIIERAPVGSVFEVEQKIGKWYEIKFQSKLGILISGFIQEKSVLVLREKSGDRKKRVVQLEALGSYFQPLDQAFREIYGTDAYYGGEICINLKKGIAFWAGGHFFEAKGKTTFTEEETEIQVFPIYFGMKFKTTNEQVMPYIGIGAGYFRYKETSEIGLIKKGDLGFIGQIGLMFRIIGPLSLDFRCSYSYCKVKPADVEANLGGFQGTVGLGFEF